VFFALTQDSGFTRLMNNAAADKETFTHVHIDLSTDNKNKYNVLNIKSIQAGSNAVQKEDMFVLTISLFTPKYALSIPNGT